MGAQVANSEAVDVDGVPDLMTINIDKHERLFELDMWKFDYNPLVRWPVAADPRIGKGGGRSEA
jgi:hypothetical protein